MKKLVLAVVMAVVVMLAVQIWAQEIHSSEGVFIGTITKVDPDGRGFFVRNEAGEFFFQWNKNTRISGFPSIEGELIADTLKKGMVVRIFYTEPGMIRVVGRIEVKKGEVETMKGWEHPFGCGISLCWSEGGTEGLFTKPSMGSGPMMLFTRRLGWVNVDGRIGKKGQMVKKVVANLGGYVVSFFNR